MFKFKKIIFISLLVSSSLRSNINVESDVEDANPFSREMESNLGRQEQTRNDLKRYKKNLFAKTKVYHELINSPAAHSSGWISPKNNLEKRRALEKIVELQIKKQIKIIESVEMRIEELEFESDWLQIQRDEWKQDSKKNANGGKKSRFQCKSLPVEPADLSARISQGFGRQRDEDTGLHWMSSGWWLKRIAAKVHACDRGVVAFVGEMPGRGRVVMLDHGHGRMTLYANLSETLGPSLRRLAKVNAGDWIGSPKDRVYFEVREDGQAIDPNEVFLPADRSKFTYE